MTTNEIEWKNCWKKPVKVQFKEITETAEIETREGKLYGYAGKDVLLKGIRGEVYPCKIDIFKDTYTTTEPKSEETIRAERTKEIFDRLDKTMWERIEPSKIVEFYEQFNNSKEVDESIKIIKSFSVVGLEREKYEALKKEFGVD